MMFIRKMYICDSSRYCYRFTFQDIFMNSGINFKVYITLHSYGQIIIFPYACSHELAPDYVRLLQGATAMSKVCNLIKYMYMFKQTY